MSCFDNLSISAINFGDIEGKDEFTTDYDDETKKRIEYTFVHLDKNEVDNLLSKQKYFIYGNKGTGKTSLINYLHMKLSNSKEQTVLVLFKEVKEDPAIYTQLKALINSLDEQDMDITALTFWRWFLLSLVLREYCGYQEKYSIFFNTKNNIFFKLSHSLSHLIRFFIPTATYEGVEYSIGGSYEEANSSNTIDPFQYASDAIAYLEAKITKDLKQKIFILCDELDITISDSRQNKILVKNLIAATKYLNKIKNVHMITSVRTEVLSAVLSGNEINKVLESKGFLLDWRDTKFDLQHPLMQVLIKKIKYSFLVSCPKEKTTIERMTDVDIFKRVFPSSLINFAYGGTFKNEQYILNTTWNKPRDIVRLMKIMQKLAKNATYFTSEHFEKALEQYGTKAWEEISEEMTARFSDEEISLAQKIFSLFQNCFKLEDFSAYLAKKGIKLDAEDFLTRLYEIGFLINHDFDVEHNRHLFRSSFRKDNLINFDMYIEVHRGIWGAFPSMKDTRELIRHGNKAHVQETNDLADKLRELKIR